MMSAHEESARILSVAVDAIGGTPRSGQVEMAQAVDRAIDEEIHLLVQAGTGTGKSLGYLAPAIAHAVLDDEAVVVATATLALQAQLAGKDIPAALTAAEKVLPRRPRAAVLKGRHNHACLHKVRGGSSRPDQDMLLDDADSSAAGSAGKGTDQASELGAEVIALRQWAEQQAAENGVGDRDDAPAHSQQAWDQVSMRANECLGAQNCPFGPQCLAERARERARDADIVVTNHAMLAIDAMNGGTLLPEHDVVVIDEAHEVVDRFTGAASVDLWPGRLSTVVRQGLTWLDDDLGADLLDQVDVLHEALEATQPGRITDPRSQLLIATTTLRGLTRQALSVMNPQDEDEKSDPDRVQAHAAMREVFEITDRVCALRTEDVVWVSESERGERSVHVAPLSVSGLLRQHVLTTATTILTSATLKIGGELGSAARDVGLSSQEYIADEAPEVMETQLGWRGLDVGSPFDYARQGIMFVGRSLPRPGRDQMPHEVLDALVQLVQAAGGRTLGLFASQRNAEAAAQYVREQLHDLTILRQGEGHLAELTRRFTAEPQTCLFGTMSLWQGVDVPGDTCRLVVIDKIPFPRPDDPLVLARSQAVEEAGGNGFMAISARRAALLLAQGAGRLIRRSDDRGVVAVLDPRLSTARYAGYLRKSMPQFWMTTDLSTTLAALRRLGQ